MIHLLDTDPRQYTEPENYKYNHGSLSSVMININQQLKRNNAYAEPDDAEWVGICDGLNVGFKYKNKKSFLISCWEMQNTIPLALLREVKRTNQKLIGMSNQIANLWKKYEFDCEVMHLGADTNFWKPSKPKNKNQFVFILPLATFVRSGIDLTLEAYSIAFQNNKDVILKIKDTEASEQYLKKIKYYKDKGCNIEYYSGRWSMQELRDFYSSAHVCLSLQRSASFGLMIVESMSCNTLNITGNIEPFNEFLNKNFALLVEPKSTVPINKYLNTLVNEWGFKNTYGNFEYIEKPMFYDYDVQEYAKIIQFSYDNWEKLSKINYRDYIINNYTWDRSAKKLIEILNK